MSNKQFKAESKRLLDLMINSIYTNKEIFLRELISNASDAIDKLYYRSLTDKNLDIKRGDLKIKINLDKEKRTICISDNGIGMTEEELDKNLGTIAKSGSLLFKEQNEKKDDIDIIGQFGVGFYSAFMVSDLVRVESKSVDSQKAYAWTSKGAEGYSIEECDKEDFGTKITLHIKEDKDEEKYSEYLEEYKIEDIVKKYSDYIKYKIVMDVEKDGKKEEKVLNSMTPIWKKDKKTVKKEEYDEFYKQKFFDYENPLHVVHTSVEGQYKYDALLYIPSHLPVDFYADDYQKGLQLYANGVLIMDKCEDLLPDYLGFVKGLVDSDDLSLNISREMLQHDRQLRVIARNLEKKMLSELENMKEKDRKKYDEFFKKFGIQLKYGAYNNYGLNKDKLKDLLLFYSSKNKKYITLKEYVSNLGEDDKNIYYACGDSIDKIDMLPQVELLKDKNIDVLYLTDKVDEFVLQVIFEYEGKSFKNVSSDKIDIGTEEEKESLKKENEENKAMFDEMKVALGNDVEEIRFTNRLKNHPVCLTSEGEISVEMEKTLNAMPNHQDIKAKTILEINKDHEIAKKLKNLYVNDKESLKKYAKVLYAQARLIEGLDVEDPTDISNIICDILSK